MPTVRVIIPPYTCAQLVPEAVRSMLASTFKDDKRSLRALEVHDAPKGKPLGRVTA